MIGDHRVEELAERGYRRYSSFERRLSEDCIAELNYLREKLVEHGRDLKMPHSKALRNGVLELRGECDHTELRVYYFWCRKRQTFILASAELKKGKADQSLIRDAGKARKALCTGGSA